MGQVSNYGKELHNIAKRHVLRIDPEIKKTMCKKCKCIMVYKQKPGEKIKKGKFQMECIKCEEFKGFLAKKMKNIVQK